MAAGTPTPEGHDVRRVVLPSGRTIEVVQSGSDAALRPVERAAPSTDQPRRELHICRECACDLVYPTEWEEAGPECWRVELRCPNCEWSVTGVFPQELVDAFDEKLDDGTEKVVNDLRRLMHANMSEEIDRFAAALHADALLPEDF